MLAIISLGPNGEMGYKGQLMASPDPIWKSLDLAYFKAFTMGKTIVAGRATAQSMSHLKLEGRTCRYMSASSKEPIGVFTHIEASQLSDDMVVIGGAKLIQSMAHQLDIIVVQRPVSGPCDTYLKVTYDNSFVRIGKAHLG